MKKFLALSISLGVITACATGCAPEQGDTVNSETDDSYFATDDLPDESAETAADDLITNETAAPSYDSYVEGPAADMAQAVYDSVGFPAMMDMNYEPEIVLSFLGVDVGDCEDYYFANAMISVNLNEVMIAKPKAGREDALKEAFDSHFAYIKDGAAFYPQQEVSAAGAVEGVLDNGYYYIIVHENGSAAEDGLKAWLSGGTLPNKPSGDDAPEEGASDAPSGGGFGGMIEIPVGSIGELGGGSDTSDGGATGSEGSSDGGIGGALIEVPVLTLPDNNDDEAPSGGSADRPDDGGSTGVDVMEHDISAAAMAGVVFDAVEFPSMIDMGFDPEIVLSFLGIDVDDCEDYYFSNAMINVNLNEVLIARPKPGREDALKAAFDSHFAYIKDGAAFYPQQEVSAAGAVSGITPDGYYYIIVHENGAAAEDALMASLR